MKKPFEPVEVHQLPRTLTTKWELCWQRRSRLEELEAGVVRRTQELMAANERLRQQAALLDKAEDAIIVWDLEDKVHFWNKSAERL